MPDDQIHAPFPKSNPMLADHSVVTVRVLAALPIHLAGTTFSRHRRSLAIEERLTSFAFVNTIPNDAPRSTNTNARHRHDAGRVHGMVLRCDSPYPSRYGCRTPLTRILPRMLGGALK